ncbi:chemotaxis-specific protein-glutamate methyltransferase CheB [Acetobacterium fimetarium]|uniref:Protein-glutamate methylesterase/protein-glutamine glutaminase n=1 Tax=Acetobacterium fimetarium TaxID=52691 RepID=A0ABR6WSL4_9FIRM|nr:chemotaxis response regulator protein-glutamate methylesterase [Acetobacterium fimetarium]MBC3803221.1 chemotaxis-specific protein-glutamate methyltransferase CheB [Acetobacterium fimetarium]
MITKEKIKVLIIDDSRVYRDVMSWGLSLDPDIEVVATAQDAYDARDKILQYRPNVITCDFEMPKMNGVEFLRQLIPQYPLPAIVVSSFSLELLEILNVGATDFVSKPNLNVSKNVDDFFYELRKKIKWAVQGKPVVSKQITTQQRLIGKLNVSSDRLIAIGASTGGTEAIFNILKNLTPDCPGIVIVQHIPPVFSKMYAERLNLQTPLECKEAEHGDIVETGKVLLAPGGQHMRVKKIGEKYKVEVFTGEKVNGHCPSVDVLFESVAKEAGKKAIGIILTGMGSDGAKGLLSIRSSGAVTIGQDEESSVVYGMPQVAYNIGGVEIQAPLENIPKLIRATVNE